jgi:hypothetical protein
MWLALSQICPMGQVSSVMHPPVAADMQRPPTHSSPVRQL